MSEGAPRNTIVPGHHPGNANVDPALAERWKPSTGARREVDVSTQSAFPEVRRFQTVHPGSKESAEATTAAYRAAREHDRQAAARFLPFLPKPDLDDNDDDLDGDRNDE